MPAQPTAFERSSLRVLFDACVSEDDETVVLTSDFTALTMSMGEQVRAGPKYT